MATVNRAFFSWTSGPGGDFTPGSAHNWWMTGFKYGDVLSVTAHSVVGNPFAPHRVLAVENVRVDGDPGGHTFLFTVRNVGSFSTPGYGVGISWISS
ncbi:MAG TPA: hypothetical protein VK638_36815 [Edaphobacter sp.]|nr:hypothetical protein [Edaphobacter sp.]